MYVIYYTTIVNLPTRAVARSLNTQIEYGSNNKVYSKQCNNVHTVYYYTPSCCQIEGQRNGEALDQAHLYSIHLRHRESSPFCTQIGVPRQFQLVRIPRKLVRIPIEGLFFGWQYFTLYSKINHIGRGKNNKYRIHSKLDNNKEKMKSFLKKTTQQKIPI